MYVHTSAKTIPKIKPCQSAQSRYSGRLFESIPFVQVALYYSEKWLNSVITLSSLCDGDCIGYFAEGCGRQCICAAWEKIAEHALTFQQIVWRCQSCTFAWLHKSWACESLHVLSALLLYIVVHALASCIRLYYRLLVTGC